MIGIALAAGLLFGISLSLSLGPGGMTQPAMVLGFLDIFGAWDPRLVFVMAGAVLTTAIGYRLVLRRPRPLLAEQLQWPTSRPIDARLVGGALFGIGWGIAGYCSGPALASLRAGVPALLVLLACMIAGWWLAARLLPPIGGKAR